MTDWIYATAKRGRHNGWRRPLTGHVNKSGHIVVTLHDGPRRKRTLLHRVVLETFVGPCPDGMEGGHYDGDPGNNRLENLRWDTRRVNEAIRRI